MVIRIIKSIFIAAIAVYLVFVFIRKKVGERKMKGREL